MLVLLDAGLAEPLSLGSRTLRVVCKRTLGLGKKLEKGKGSHLGNSLSP